MLRKVLAAAVSTAFLASPAFAQSLSEAQQFLQQAVPSNMFEIQSSELALERAKNDDIQSFAQKMVQDHQQAAEKIQSAVAQEEESLELPSSLDEKHQSMIDQLSELEDDDFDQKYVSMQVSAHEEAVNLYSNFADNGDGRPLKKAAGELLPILEEHLEMAKKLD